jgi:hypothetical protein
MKAILLLIMMLSFTTATFGQDTAALATKREYYLQKANNQKTTGWILLAGGTTLGIIGVILVSNSDELDLFSSGDDNGVTNGSIMFIAGVAADLASIPFFISAGNYRRLAAEISVGTQQIHFPQNTTAEVKYAPTVSIKIRF